MVQEVFEIARITYYDPTTGFFVARSTEEQSLKGSSIIQPHGKIVCSGEWGNDPKWGKQFRVEQIFYNDLADIMHVLLSSGFLKGIRAKKCDDLIGKLGLRTFDVLDACVLQDEVRQPIMLDWNGKETSAMMLLMGVPGIKGKTYKKIIESWKQNKGSATAAVLSIRAGLTIRQFRNAIEEIGPKLLEEYILTSPYDLTEVDGFTWDIVDAISALEWEGKTKIAHDSSQRAAAAVREIIRKNSLQGHTCMLKKIAMVQAAELAKLPNIAERINWPTSNLVEVDEFITTKKWYRVLEDSAYKLRAIQTAKFQGNDIPVEFFQLGNLNDFSEGVELGDEQKVAIQVALANPVSIITGPPGVGKSSVTNTILNVMDKYQITYTLCAPTGAAKVRISEITGRLAHTLHMYFQFNNPLYEIELDTDYLIIDEISMVDNYLLWQVLKKVSPGQRIIFIGDADQLPPVSPGEPLLQMIEGGIPTAWLKKIYRNDGGIVRAAKSILNSDVPGTDDNFMVVRETESGIKSRLVKAIQWLIDEKGFAFDDIQVLSPINKGAAGKNELNAHIQAVFNPGSVIEGTKFRENDRVVHIKNDYGLGVMNGEVGKVIGPSQNDDPFESDESLIDVKFYTQDGIVGYDDEHLDKLQLAFASTIHKFQGAQQEAVIVIMPPTTPSFYLRQLPYTGITRAKKFCIVMNIAGAFEQYIKSKVSTRRHDLLGYFLKQKGLTNAAMEPLAQI